MQYLSIEPDRAYTVWMEGRGEKRKEKVGKCSLYFVWEFNERKEKKLIIK